MTIGIYALFWEEQDLIYIGQSVNIEQRFKEHLYSLKKLEHSNYKVQEAYNRYGIFSSLIIEECSIEELNNKEILWTKEFNSINTGLNIVEAGKAGYGINSNNSKYTKIQILRVFSLLYKYPHLSCKKIAHKTKVHFETVQSINNGYNHIWLQNSYPEQWKELVSSRESRYLCSNPKKQALVKSPENIVYEVKGISVFAREHQLDIGALSKIINKQRKAHKGWTLYSIDSHEIEVDEILDFDSKY